MSLGARAIDMHAHWVPPQVAHALRQRRAAAVLEIVDALAAHENQRIRRAKINGEVG